MAGELRLVVAGVAAFALAASFAATGCAGGQSVVVSSSPAREEATPTPARTESRPLAVAQLETSTPTPSPAPALPPDVTCEWAEVVAVVDGDTLDVLLAGQAEPVRLIGVDAPETDQPLAEEAMAEHVRLAGGRVCLEADQTDRDALGRLLRYAWAEDGALINESLVAAGLAVVVTYPPDTKYVESRYIPAEASARAAGLGLWAAIQQPQAGAQTPQGFADTPDRSGCDPAYPDVCIPPASVAGDLDCGDVSKRRFRVLPPDPHGFDRDGDGVGCER